VHFDPTACEPPFISHRKDAVAAQIALLNTRTRTLMQCIFDFLFVSHIFVPLLQVQVFVDATLDVVPYPFYQYLIIIMFDACLQIFIPGAYILITSKTNECYWQAFH
jgi:hypothetical protein